MAELNDRWGAALTYENYMGRWSRALAPRFVAWLAVPPLAHWLDVGCGTGALSNAICSGAEPASVTGCDPAGAFIRYAREHSRDERESFVIAGVPGVPRRAGGYGCVASLLAFNFIPDSGAAIEEMASVAAPRGTVAVCVWDYAEGMDYLRLFWEAATALDPGARELDEGFRFPICRPEALTELFRSAGLDGVRCEPIILAMEFADFDDFWSPFLGGTGPAPSYVAALEPERRAALARKLEQSLPRGSGGNIPLTARAWVVRGETGP